MLERRDEVEAPGRSAKYGERTSVARSRSNCDMSVGHRLRLRGAVRTPIRGVARAPAQNGQARTTAEADEIVLIHHVFNKASASLRNQVARRE